MCQSNEPSASESVAKSTPTATKLSQNPACNKAQGSTTTTAFAWSDAPTGAASAPFYLRLYGENGSVVTTNDTAYAVRLGKTPLQARMAKAERRVPLGWFATTVRAGRDPVEDPSSLANNLITMQILEAARRSAAEGRTIKLSELDPPR